MPHISEVMVGKPWEQEEEAGHVEPAVRKQGQTNANFQFSFQELSPWDDFFHFNIKTLLKTNPDDCLLGV